jgi:hypothetical protein
MPLRRQTVISAAKGTAAKAKQLTELGGHSSQSHTYCPVAQSGRSVVGMGKDRRKL